jgi:hypothetical protein
MPKILKPLLILALYVVLFAGSVIQTTFSYNYLSDINNVSLLKEATQLKTNADFLAVKIESVDVVPFYYESTAGDKTSLILQINANSPTTFVTVAKKEAIDQGYFQIGSVNTFSNSHSYDYRDVDSKSSEILRKFSQFNPDIKSPVLLYPASNDFDLFFRLYTRSQFLWVLAIVGIVHYLIINHQQSNITRQARIDRIRQANQMEEDTKKANNLDIINARVNGDQTTPQNPDNPQPAVDTKLEPIVQKNHYNTTHSWIDKIRGLFGGIFVLVIIVSLIYNTFINKNKNSQPTDGGQDIVSNTVNLTKNNKVGFIDSVMTLEDIQTYLRSKKGGEYTLDDVAYIAYNTNPTIFAEFIKSIEKPENLEFATKAREVGEFAIKFPNGYEVFEEQSESIASYIFKPKEAPDDKDSLNFVNFIQAIDIIKTKGKKEGNTYIMKVKEKRQFVLTLDPQDDNKYLDLSFELRDNISSQSCQKQDCVNS